MRVGQQGRASHAGRRRRHNEDSFVVRPPLFAVADGMGGAQAGELASQLAAGALAGDAGAGPARERVVALIQEANRRVYERSTADETASGMGTTLTVALVDADVVWIGHVGDSRAYLFRDGALDQLTDDHSLVAELVRSGRLSEEEAETHPQRSVITRALGTDPDVDVDSFAVEARPGDVVLLCSDGLTTMLSDDAIAALVAESRGDLQRAAKRLVAAANRRGGEDNITVVLFDVLADGDGATAAYPAVGAETEAADEEDTLDELDAVPAVDTMVVPVEEIRAREDEWLAEAPTAAAPAVAPGPAPARSLARRLLWLALGLAVALVVAALVVWGVSRAHFVGARADGRVAVYQGLPYDIAGPVRLYRPVYVSDRLRAVQLSPAERRRLFAHDLESRGAAQASVRRYEQDVFP